MPARAQLVRHMRQSAWLAMLLDWAPTRSTFWDGDVRQVPRQVGKLLVPRIYGMEG